MPHALEVRRRAARARAPSKDPAPERPVLDPCNDARLAWPEARRGAGCATLRPADCGTVTPFSSTPIPLRGTRKPQFWCGSTAFRRLHQGPRGLGQFVAAPRTAGPEGRIRPAETIKKSDDWDLPCKPPRRFPVLSADRVRSEGKGHSAHDLHFPRRHRSRGRQMRHEHPVWLCKGPAIIGRRTGAIASVRSLSWTPDSTFDYWGQCNSFYRRGMHL